MKRIYLAFVVAMVSVLVAITSGCDNNDTTGYKKFIVIEGLAHFSFEYPAFYYEPRIYRSLEPYSIEVTASGIIQPGVGTQPGRGDELLSISIFQASDSFPNAKYMLDHNLSCVEEHQDFELLENSPVTVAGIHGEQIIYSYYGYHLTHEAAAETGTVYDAYFDSKGSIWEIYMVVDEYAAAERARADFEHILETFQILD